MTPDEQRYQEQRDEEISALKESGNTIDPFEKDNQERAANITTLVEKEGDAGAEPACGWNPNCYLNKASNAAGELAKQIFVDARMAAAGNRAAVIADNSGGDANAAVDTVRENAERVGEKVKEEATKYAQQVIDPATGKVVVKGIVGVVGSVKIAKNIIGSVPSVGLRYNSKAKRWIDDSGKFISVPTLPAKDFSTFKTAPIPIMFKPGAKLYRITIPGRESGSYWTLERPKDISDFRKRWAVHSDWNQGTHIVEYTVPHDKSIVAWVGQAAEQKYKGTKLDGGGTQVWVPSGLIAGNAVPFK
jgi:hypothetical protein